MKRCNRCKVIKNSDEFKSEKLKTCNNCSDVRNEGYRLKEGKLPKYAIIQRDLKDAFNRGNFICKKCKVEKSITDFGIHTGNNKYNLSRVCKECNREVDKFSTINKYGLSKKDFIAMLENQDSKCKICKSEIKYMSRFNNRTESACVDHDHKTGKVRGLLCSNCNRGIGLLKDDPKILKRAYKYVVQFKSDKLLESPEMDNQQPITNLNG